MHKVLLAAVVLSFSLHARADDTAADAKPKSSVKIQDVTESGNKVDGNIDEEVTNSKLRADSGSKSKFSLSILTTYNGGALSSAFAADRPNLAAIPGQQVTSSIQGGLNGRYRWDKHDSITLGTTYGINTPFEGQVQGGTSQFDVYDPNAAYNRVDKIGNVQTLATVSYAYGTSTESRSIDLTHQFGVLYEGAYAMDRWTLGNMVAMDYNMYDSQPGQNASTLIGAYDHDGRVAWDASMYPFLEYKLNDTVTFRTVFGYFNWKHLYGDANEWRLLQKFVYQSIGAAVFITRDIYLYPSIQFVPNHLASNFTNVSLTATMNVF